MYTRAILGTHLFLPIEELQTSINKLRAKLTARPKYPELASIPMYDESRVGYFGIPRHYGVDLSKIGVVDSEVSTGEYVAHVFTSILRDNQKPLYDEFIASVEGGKTGFILNARTGSGKTVLLLKFLEYLGVNALVIVPTTSLLDQWKDRIVEHTQHARQDIGHVQADIIDYIDKPITLATIQSACKDKYGEDFRNYFGVIVYDELHRTGAEQFSTVVSSFRAKYRIGASGTLDRPDGMDVVFRNHLGEKIISLGEGREEENRPRVLVIEYSGAKKFIPSWTAKLDKVRKRGVVISALAKDTKRSDVLVSLVIKLALSGRRVLVLSDRIDQLKYMLDKTHPSHKPGLFISTTTKEDKRDVIDNSGIVYATYGMFSTGMDVPDLAGLVFATPQSRVRQAIGRVSRLCKGKKRPVVVDLVDKDISECGNWHRSRVAEYKHRDVKGELITA